MRNEYNEQFNPVVSISSVVSTGSTTGGTPGSVLVESVVSTGSTTAPSVPELVEGTTTKLVEGTTTKPVEGTDTIPVEGTSFNKP